MKLKLMPMLTGVIAAAAMAATPLVALAQAPQTQPQTQEARPRPRITLSREQQAEFEQIQARTITEIEAVLTPKQKTQFAAARESGEGLGAIQDLSEPQITKIQTILESFNTQLGNLLTQEQKQQIEQSQPSRQ